MSFSPAHFPMALRVLAPGLLLLSALGCQTKAKEKAEPAPPEQTQSEVAAAPSASANEPTIKVRQLVPEHQEVIDACTNLCVKTFDLDCGDPEICAKSCASQYLLPICQTELKAALKCALDSPLTDFECREGAPKLKTSACTVTGEAAIACIKASMDLKPVTR